MKKLLISLVVLCLAAIVYANNYEYSVVVFPAQTDESITFENVPYQISESVSKCINKAYDTCSITFHPKSGLMTYLVEQGKIEESDLNMPLDPAEYDRIAQAMDADAYCVIEAKEFVQNEKKFKASCVFNVKIIPVGNDEPVFEETITSRYGGFEGYWKKLTPESCMRKLTKNFSSIFAKKVSSFNGFKYKPVKKVESPILTEDEE